jgi:DNA-binding response OmpR family regulator
LAPDGRDSRAIAGSRLVKDLFNAPRHAVDAAGVLSTLTGEMTEMTAAGREHGRPASPPGGAQMRLAVLDTDTGFLQVLSRRLERLGWEHRVLPSAVPVEAVVAMRLNAIVIDVALLGQAAGEYVERLCSSLPGLGVIVCTGSSTVAQRVRGLRMGADDWVTKPCHPEELIARVEAVVRRRRRAEARETREPIVAGELEIRADRFQAYVRDVSVDLTRREFELIELLAAAEGRVLEREEIYQRVWGYAMARGDRSVDVFVRKLRQKLESASPGWRYIHTHFGVGYRFSPERDGASPEAGEHPAPEMARGADAEHDAVATIVDRDSAVPA